MSNTVRPKTILTTLSLLLTVLFLGGVFAGRWTLSYPINQTFGYWDVARSLGTAARAKGSRAMVAEAFWHPNQARQEMDSYLWVPEMTAIPMLGFTNAATTNAPIVGPGFRNPAEPQIPKPPGLMRIFLIGGSTAFSVGAPNEAWTIGQRLVSHLRTSVDQPVEVITFATPSWTSNQERAAALNIVAPLEPDLVISLSGVNDLVFAHMGRSPHLQRGHYEQTFFEVLSMAHQLAGRGPLHDAAPTSPQPTPVDTAIHRVVENTALIRFGLGRAGSRYLYVLQPTLYTATGLTKREQQMLAKQPSGKSTYFSLAYPKLRGAVQAELGATNFLDLSDAFAQREPKEEVFIDAYHFGDRGNDYLAKAIAKKVSSLPLTERQ